MITKQRSARSCLFHLPTGAAGRGTSSGISCKGRICAQRRARPETRSWDVLGHAGAAGVRRRLGRAGLIPGSTWQQQMEEPRVIPAGVGAGRGGHDRRTKPRIYSCRPFTVSPSLPPCTGLFLHFLCFSCLLGHPGAGTHTKSEPWPSLSLLPPALRAPLRPQEHSGAIDPAGRACPGPGWAGGVRGPPGHPPLRGLWRWDFKEGAPKGLGLSALPAFIPPPRLVGGMSADVRQSKHMGGHIYFTRACFGSAYLS